MNNSTSVRLALRSAVRAALITTPKNRVVPPTNAVAAAACRLRVSPRLWLSTKTTTTTTTTQQPAVATSSQQPPQSQPHKILRRTNSNQFSTAAAAELHRDDEDENEDHSSNNNNNNNSDDSTTKNNSSITTPTTLDAFRIFDLPYQFDINEGELKRKYHELMKNLHPDHHHHHHHSDNHDLANQANAAYDILKQPHVRATHLLELLGRPMEEGEAAMDVIGMEFLMEIMHYREEIEDVIHCANCGKDHKQGKLEQLHFDNTTRISATCKQLTKAFAEQDVEQAARLTAQLQYWNRIHETIREHMEM